MPSIEILRGYSASGKSTYARGSGKTIVSRDAIRAMLTGNPAKQVLSQEQEALVSDIQVAAVKAVVKRGEDVVIDDTNLVLKFARHWADLAVALGVEWTVRDFQPTVTNVKRWNACRANGVPDQIIDSQIKRFPYKQWREVKPSADTKSVFKTYVPDWNLPAAVGFDLDGTLAHMGDRNPYDTSRYYADTVDDNLRGLNRLLSIAGAKVIIFSGRSDEHRHIVVEWLRKHEILYDQLVMRKTGDNRRDDVVKSELFDEFIAPNYNFLYHFDDRDRVVQALRAKGITVYQVAEGDF